MPRPVSHTHVQLCLLCLSAQFEAPQVAVVAHGCMPHVDHSGARNEVPLAGRDQTARVQAEWTAPQQQIPLRFMSSTQRRATGSAILSTFLGIPPGVQQNLNFAGRRQVHTGTKNIKRASSGRIRNRQHVLPFLWRHHLLHRIGHELSIGTGLVLIHGMQNGVPGSVQIRRQIVWVQVHVSDQRINPEAIPSNDVVRLMHGRHPVVTVPMHLTRRSLKQVKQDLLVSVCH
ncbi:hypothetical protein PBRA_007741 [Plasmodiophora brassicae]|uniref:Secreted protein n=1 Tax=Plasmodiophora brassicae TaxID=37360 RepID=A0A0G4IXN3_PLABS|nr:hypothetical protein PBRA_007741 [Plasmodiophora brassicae]